MSHAANVIVRTDADDEIAGHSFVFTIGRGNDVQVAGIDALAGHRAEEAAAEIAAGDDGLGLGQLMKPAQSAQPATPPEIPAAAPALP